MGYFLGKPILHEGIFKLDIIERMTVTTSDMYGLEELVNKYILLIQLFFSSFFDTAKR